MMQGIRMNKRKKFREMGIRDQMQSIVAVTIIMLVILCAVTNVSIKQLVYRNMDEHVDSMALRLSSEIELTFEKIKNFCISIGEDEAVQALMRSDYSEMSLNLEEAKECLIRHRILEPMIEDISLINDRIHYSSVYSKDEMDEIRQTVGGVPFTWLGIRQHGFTPLQGNPEMMVYAGDITVGNENLGTVVISIDITGFVAENEKEMNARYFLADRDGVLFSFNGSNEEAEQIWRIWAPYRQEERIEKDGYFIHSCYFEDMDCYLVSVLDTGGSALKMNWIQFFSWSTVILSVIFCVIFFLLILRGIVSPLHQFDNTIRQIRTQHQRGLKGELELKGCAEITQIGKEFSGMLMDIEQLNRQIFQSATDLYEIKVQKQEAELAYLRSQIDPHFLYNTLEVVRKMALVKNAPEIAQMAVDMGNIFRYSTKGEDEVPLENEISIIKSYIRIQQMRFEGKIEVFYFVSEEVLQQKVMKMLLQPIVENSIFHGLEPKGEQGSLYIGARKESGQLVITVKDDGMGIAPEKLSEIQKALQEENVDTSKHVGILNTNARIRLLYGKEYGLAIESCASDGTTVTIRLPLG